MKTLDEVIKSITKQSGLEIRNVKKPDKDRFWVDRETYMDALHYLKEYRDKHDEILKTEEALGYCEMAENRPLTWSELKQMEGKPVLVVEEGYQTWEYWSIVYWMKDDELTLLNENGQMTYSKNEQGTVWQAYRKERS